MKARFLWKNSEHEIFPEDNAIAEIAFEGMFLQNVVSQGRKCKVLEPLEKVFMSAPAFYRRFARN